MNIIEIYGLYKMTHLRFTTLVFFLAVVLISATEQSYAIDSLSDLSSEDVGSFIVKGEKTHTSPICEKIPPPITDVYIQNIINSFDNVILESQIKGSQLRRLLEQVRRDCVIPGVAVFIERLIIADEDIDIIANTAIRYAWTLQTDPTNLEALVGLNAYIDAYGEALSHILLRASFSAQNTLVQTRYASHPTEVECLSDQCISMLEREIVTISDSFQIFFTQYNTIVFDYSQYLLILNGGAPSNNRGDSYVRKGEEDADIDPLIRVLRRVEPFSSRAIRELEPLANTVEKSCNLAGVAVFIESVIVQLRETISIANIGIADAIILEEDPTNLTALTDINAQLEGLGITLGGNIIRDLFGAQITLIESAGKQCLASKERTRLATIINENVQSIAFPAYRIILAPARAAFQRYLVELLSSHRENSYRENSHGSSCRNDLKRIKRPIISCDQTTPPTCEYLDGMITDFTFLQIESEKQQVPLRQFINILNRDCNVAGVTIFMERFNILLSEMQNIAETVKRYINILRLDTTNLEALVATNLYIDLYLENRRHLEIRTTNGAQNTLIQIRHSQASNDYHHGRDDCSKCLSESAILLIEEKVISTRKAFGAIGPRLVGLNDYLANYLFVINTGQTPPESLPDVIVNITTTSIICKNTTKLQDSIQAVIDGFQTAIIYLQIEVSNLQLISNDVQRDCVLAGVAVFVERATNDLRDMIRLAQTETGYAEVLKREPANLNALVGLNLDMDSFNIAFVAFNRDLLGGQTTLIEGGCCISPTQRTNISTQLYTQFATLDSQFEIIRAPGIAFEAYLFELVTAPISNKYKELEY